MVVSRSDKINGGRLSQRVSSRLIPRRGQVKVAIVVELAHLFAFIFSLKSQKQMC
ncbi:hypothetical protein ACJRO7_021478 [Eucalyptus globulus]|uniref:Uncharacterized protein n=1 Tax=Eucalyptus globulus TaxID=34317 RepID=A0ABD3KLH5_EUCGL